MTAPFLPEVFGDFLLMQRLARSAMAEVLLAVRLGDRSGRTYVVERPLIGERASGRAVQAIAREAEVLEAVRGRGSPRSRRPRKSPGCLTPRWSTSAACRSTSSSRLPLPRGAVVAVASDVARALATWFLPEPP